MANAIDLEIVSPVKQVYKGEVKSVTAPGTLGSFQVLFNHAPMVATFGVGHLKAETLSGELKEFSTSGGVFEIKDNKAIVLAETIESKEEIDIKRAQQAKLRAEEIVRLDEASKTEKVKAKEDLQKAENRIKLLEKSNI